MDHNDPVLTQSLLPGQGPCDNPTLACRIFKHRLKQLIDDLVDGEIFKLNGVKIPALFVIHTIEFQTRGLPHAHIVLRLDYSALGEGRLDPINRFVFART